MALATGDALPLVPRGRPPPGGHEAGAGDRPDPRRSPRLAAAVGRKAPGQALRDRRRDRRAHPCPRRGRIPAAARLAAGEPHRAPVHARRAPDDRRHRPDGPLLAPLRPRSDAGAAPPGAGPRRCSSGRPGPGTRAPTCWASGRSSTGSRPTGTRSSARSARPTSRRLRRTPSPTPTASAEHDLSVQGATYRAIPTSAYRPWCLRRLQAGYRGAAPGRGRHRARDPRAPRLLGAPLARRRVPLRPRPGRHGAVLQGDADGAGLSGQGSLSTIRAGQCASEWPGSCAIPIAVRRPDGRHRPTQR